MLGMQRSGGQGGEATTTVNGTIDDIAHIIRGTDTAPYLWRGTAHRNIDGDMRLVIGKMANIIIAYGRKDGLTGMNASGHGARANMIRHYQDLEVGHLVEIEVVSGAVVIGETATTATRNHS